MFPKRMQGPWSELRWRDSPWRASVREDSRGDKYGVCSVFRPATKWTVSSASLSKKALKKFSETPNRC